MTGSHPYRLRIGFGLLGGMAAWGLHLGVSYFAVPWVCARDAGGVLHGLTLAGAAAAGAATWAGWSAYRRMGDPVRPDAFDPQTAAPTPGPGEAAVSSAARGAGLAPFLALSGVALSGFFLVLILLEGLPVLLQPDPCLHVPTLDRLIIMGPQEGSEAAATAWGGAATAWGLPFLAALTARSGPAGAHDPDAVGPGELWAAWHWDPWLVAALATAALAYAAGLARLWRRAGRGRGIPVWRAGAYFGGVATLFVALVSPVHAAGQALFSLHMVQHLLLMVVAAPLLVLGWPLVAFLWALPVRWRRGTTLRRARVAPLEGAWRALAHPATVFVLHVGALWAWHTPQLYQAALRTPWVHDLEHASFLFTALLFWWALARPGGAWGRARYGAAILYVFATALQSGALGALITFAPRPWYPWHEAGTAAWGISPLVDQQLAGILMWVPAGLVYAAAAVALFVAWLREAERSVGRWERRAIASPASAGGVGPPSRPGGGC